MIQRMRFACILMVVLLHTVQPDFNVGDKLSYYLILAVHSLSRIAVPFFFFVSGYFFFNGFDDRWDWQLWLKKLKARFKSLFIPYVIWNVLAALYFIIPMFVGKNRAGFSGLPAWLSVHGGPLGFLCFDPVFHGPINMPLWFLRDLMVMCIISPLFYGAIKMMRKWGIVLIFCFLISNICSGYTGFSRIAILFFMGGAYFSVNKINPFECFSKYKSLIYVIASLLLVSMIAIGDEKSLFYIYVQHFYEVVGGCALFNLVSRMNSSKTSLFGEWLLRSVFWIYASHIIILRTRSFHMFENAISSFSNFIGGHFFYYIVVTGVLIICCILLYAIMNKCSKKLLVFLCGGR